MAIASDDFKRQDVTDKERKSRMDYWWIIAVIVVWIVLQAYILPKFGIST